MTPLPNLTDPTVLRQQLRRFGIRPSPTLSQNFLVDADVLATMTDAAALSRTDLVLEVGAGTGVLTQELAARAKHVVAVELDQQLIGMLTELTKERKNVTVVRADAAHVAVAQLLTHFPTLPKRYVVVANLPYHITSLFLHRFLEAVHPPAAMTLLVQREVAERVCAEPGQLSVLGVSVQVYAEPAIVATVPPSAFWPAPKVSSAILQVTRRRVPLWPDAIRSSAFMLLKAGFSARRKTLANALAGSLRVPRPELLTWFTTHGIAENARAQELTVEDWARLADHLAELRIS